MGSDADVPLETLLKSLPQSARTIGERSKVIAGIAIDSRRVQPGSLFVALRGEHTDGHRFIGQAAERGASAVVMEERCEVPPGVTAIVVPDSTLALSSIADAYYGHPSQQLQVAGVTGTNGKTTTTQMVAAILSSAGLPCGTIGTIGARLGEREWPLSNTTPLAAELQELLAQMRDGGASAVAMEVSSHALALSRVADVRFAVAALTNITRDHLDFHKSFEAYAAAKRRLFDMAPACALNVEDEHGERWAGELRDRKNVLTYAVARPADVRAENVRMESDGSVFSVSGQAFHINLPGRFNVANALAAISIARILGVTDADSARGLETLRRVAGRMDCVSGAGIDVVVDYAHTPDALENVLRTLRETTRARLFVVFGCGGDRDRGKRPQMAAAAARYADYSYVTSDNPRTEDPQAIIADILPGLGGAPHAVQPDRAAAIAEAIASAARGDVVLVAGKGHEAYQIVGENVLPFDDLAVAREALAQREAVHP